MHSFDPPYGIKFNSNWQPSTKSRDVKDGKEDSISREPEVVRAFRDTWKDGINSYLSYLRDRLIVARDLLTETAGASLFRIRVTRMYTSSDSMDGSLWIEQLLLADNGNENGRANRRDVGRNN